MRRWFSGSWAWVWACAAPLVVSAPAAAQDPPTVRSGEDGRESAALTVYNNNLGLVRETRRVTLPAGVAVLRYADVAEQIRPETVYIRDTQDAATFTVLEQNYKYDLLTPSRLLELYVERELSLVRVNSATGDEETVEATLLSTGAVTHEGYSYSYGYPYGYGGYAPAGYVDPSNVVYRTVEGITWGAVGRPVFPDVPPNFVSRPTLEWLLESPRGGARTIETTYLTWGMSWSADYVLVLTDDGRSGDLAGWVTLRNDAGLTLRGARLQLVAGDVNVQQPYDPYADMLFEASGRRGGDYHNDNIGFQESGMFEYHLYTLGRPTDVADREQKQIELLGADAVPMTKKFRLEGLSYYFVGEYAAPIENLRTDVYLEFVNAEAAGLGIALPAGVVRVYKADQGGAQQFVGEDRIEHTAREEKVKLLLGQAFDVAAERRQTDFEILGAGLYETEWEIKLRNRKTETIVVEVLEPMAGEWTIIRKSHEWVKESARLVRFDLTCPPDEEVVLTYRVRTEY
ncbi:MAG: DUF4139 domain-containing protein [Deltaproteobacteria bacterium]|nr:DUF4139 domain-containing protein [Deltaproteobacteria bacterium]